MVRIVRMINFINHKYVFLSSKNIILKFKILSIFLLNNTVKILTKDIIKYIEHCVIFMKFLNLYKT